MKYCSECGLGTEDQYKVPKFCSHCGKPFGVIASQPVTVVHNPQPVVVPARNVAFDLTVEVDTARESLVDVLTSEKTGEVKRAPAGRKNRNVVKEFEKELKSKTLE